jgi:HlyD family secretion protein
MRISLLAVVLCWPVIVASAQEEPAVSKDTIAVHEVHRGDMPLRAIASGTVSSVDPGKAVVSVPHEEVGAVRTGETASIQITPPGILRGKVGHVDLRGAGENATAEIDLTDALPQGTSVGTRANALIETGVAGNVIYFERPAEARPNTEATVFVIDPDSRHATRKTVRYGRQSGALIEVISGLAPGDRVIVTDLSRFAGQDRIRIE